MTYRRGQSLQDVKDAEEKKEPKTKGKIESKSEPVAASVVAPTKEDNTDGNSIQNTSANEKHPTLEKSSTISVKKPEASLQKSNTVNQTKVALPVVKAEKAAEPVKKTDDQEKPENEADSAIKSTEETKETSPIAHEVLIVDQKFSIKCIQAENTELSRAENLTFEVLDAELIEGGFFASNYYLYPVKVLPLE